MKIKFKIMKFINLIYKSVYKMTKIYNNNQGSIMKNKIYSKEFNKK